VSPHCLIAQDKLTRHKSIKYNTFIKPQAPLQCLRVIHNAITKRLMTDTTNMGSYQIHCSYSFTPSSTEINLHYIQRVAKIPWHSMFNMLLNLLSAFHASLYEYCLYRKQNIGQTIRLMLCRETIAVYHENQRSKKCRIFSFNPDVNPQFLNG